MLRGYINCTYIIILTCRLSSNTTGMPHLKIRVLNILMPDVQTDMGIKILKRTYKIIYRI